MTPEDFAGRWKHSPMIKFSHRPDFRRGLSDASSAALSDHGLPQTADPWLSFMEFVKVDTATASLLEEKMLYPVGCLANGSFICIDKRSDSLIIFDRNDPDDLWTLNSSLEALYESIVIYDEFITEVNRRNPNYSSDFKIPDGMLSELKHRLTICDPEAMNSHGFWYCELSALDDGSLC